MSGRKSTTKARAVTAARGLATAVEASFAEVIDLIEQARQRAYQAVNTELIGLYWQIGEYISGKLAAAEWGEGVVVMADQMTVVSNLYPIDGRGLLMSDSQRLLALCELIWALPWQRKIRSVLVAERADTAAVA